MVFTYLNILFLATVVVFMYFEMLHKLKYLGKTKQYFFTYTPVFIVWSVFVFLFCVFGFLNGPMWTILLGAIIALHELYLLLKVSKTTFYTFPSNPVQVFVKYVFMLLIMATNGMFNVILK